MSKEHVMITRSRKKFLVYCPKCGKENYIPAVASGQCVWCGYDANEDEV